MPQKDGDWLYWTAFETGGQYRNWWRKPVAGGADELLLDEPALAEGKEYFRLGAFAVSNDGRLAGLCDRRQRLGAVRDPGQGPGDRRASARRDPGHAVATSSGPRRQRRSSTASPTSSGAPTMRGCTGSAPIRPTMSSCTTRPTRASASSVGETQRAQLDRDRDRRPCHQRSAAAARERSDRRRRSWSRRARSGREYDVDEHDGTLFIHTNDVDPQFRLCTAPIDAPGEWTELIAPEPAFLHDRGRMLSRLLRRRGARGRARSDRDPSLRPAARRSGSRFPEASYAAGLGDNPEYAVDTLRLGYEIDGHAGDGVRLRRRDAAR